VNSDTLPGVASLREQLATFRYSLFRLETLPAYGGTDEDEAFAAFRAGRTAPVHAGLQAWINRVQHRVASGAVVQRVHVVVEPLTEYLRFELARYSLIVEAGEDVRILPVPQGGTWPTDVGRKDFWLIDSHVLWDMSYADDGTWLGAEPVTDPARIVAAGFIRDAAVAQSQAWSSYRTLAVH
jgi:hypothetical protein